MTDVVAWSASAEPSSSRTGESRPAQEPGGAPRVLRFLLHRPGLVASIMMLCLVVAAALLPRLFTSRDPFRTVPSERLLSPSWHHLFGTDELGRDLFARVIHGAAISLEGGLISVGVGLVFGSLIGLVSGYVGGWVDEVIMRAVDVMLSIPTLLLALVMVIATGRGAVQVAIAVGIATVASFARLMRSDVLRVRNALYVEASRALGSHKTSILLRHVLPNAAGPVVTVSILTFATAVLAVSALSFLGFGPQPPSPEWGALITDGQNYIGTAWWMSAMPGLTIMVVVLAVNRIYRALDGEWTSAP